MSKSTKKILGIVVIVILILAIVWMVYENMKLGPASVHTTNQLPDENKGIDNIINDLFENEAVNEDTNITTNEIANETVNEDEKVDNETVNNKENNSTSETVEGTTLSREEKAEKLAKEYYEDEYGNTDDIYFRYDSVYGDGRYIVVARNSSGATVAFLFVNLDTGIVTKK